MKQPIRPNQTKPGDRPLPVTYRAAQAGVLHFQPSFEDRAKIALGFGIQVHVRQLFQHQPGKIEVSARWEIVPHQAGKDTPTIKPLTKEGGA